MLKELLVIRHAKSDWSISGQKDFDRELNTRGLTTAPRVGRWLGEKGLKPDMIFSSPAKRAWRTAELVVEQWGLDVSQIVPNESIYEASPRTLMDIINGLDNTKSFAVIFGHNPGLTYIAEYLTGAVIGNIPTAGCVLIRFEVDAWSHISKDSGTLVWEQFPEGEEN